MARFYGKIGFGISREVKPGVWKDEFVEREYYGDIIRSLRKLQDGDGLNDDVNVANQVEIVADPFANENFHAMRYIEMMGAKWKVTNVEVRYPRLLLTIGGVSNVGRTTA